jgi:hypothetical protein
MCALSHHRAKFATPASLILGSVDMPSPPDGDLLYGGLMSALEIGAYVLHAKLPELGAGEILASEREGAIRIRFASGERNFIWELVAAHLRMTDQVPAPPPSARRSRKPRT